MPINHAVIKALREQRKLTQQQCADLSGMPRPHWVRMEMGRMPNPKLSTLEAVAKALRVKVQRIIT